MDEKKKVRRWDGISDLEKGMSNVEVMKKFIDGRC
jgi:hypothetical protein